MATANSANQPIGGPALIDASLLRDTINTETLKKNAARVLSRRVSALDKENVGLRTIAVQSKYTAIRANDELDLVESTLQQTVRQLSIVSKANPDDVMVGPLTSMVTVLTTRRDVLAQIAHARILEENEISRSAVNFVGTLGNLTVAASPRQISQATRKALRAAALPPSGARAANQNSASGQANGPAQRFRPAGGVSPVQQLANHRNSAAVPPAAHRQNAAALGSVQVRGSTQGQTRTATSANVVRGTNSVLKVSDPALAAIAAEQLKRNTAFQSWEKRFYENLAKQNAITARRPQNNNTGSSGPFQGVRSTVNNASERFKQARDAARARMQAMRTRMSPAAVGGGGGSLAGDIAGGAIGGLAARMLGGGALRFAGYAALAAGVGYGVHKGLNALGDEDGDIDPIGTWIDGNIPGAAWIDDKAGRIGLGRTYADQDQARRAGINKRIREAQEADKKAGGDGSAESIARKKYEELIRKQRAGNTELPASAFPDWDKMDEAQRKKLIERYQIQGDPALKPGETPMSRGNISDLLLGRMQDDNSDAARAARVRGMELMGGHGRAPQGYGTGTFNPGGSYRNPGNTHTKAGEGMRIETPASVGRSAIPGAEPPPVYRDGPGGLPGSAVPAPIPMSNVNRPTDASVAADAGGSDDNGGGAGDDRIGRARTLDPNETPISNAKPMDYDDGSGPVTPREGLVYKPSSQDYTIEAPHNLTLKMDGSTARDFVEELLKGLGISMPGGGGGTAGSPSDGSGGGGSPVPIGGGSRPGSLPGSASGGSSGGGGGQSGTGTPVVGQVPTAAGLGALSRKYESRGDAGAYGWDSTGGASYGQYQIASNTGTMGKFMQYLQQNNPEYFQRLQAAGGIEGAKAGTAQFKSAFKQLASEGAGFGEAQHGFMKSSHFDPVMQRIAASGTNVNTMSDTMKDVVWSTATGHGVGGASSVWKAAQKRVMQEKGITDPSQISEDDMIPALYAERKTRYESSTPEIRASVQRRYVKEEADAKAMLAAERKRKEEAEAAEKNKPADPNKQLPAGPDERGPSAQPVAPGTPMANSASGNQFAAADSGTTSDAGVSQPVPAGNVGAGRVAPNDSIGAGAFLANRFAARHGDEVGSTGNGSRREQDGFADPLPAPLAEPYSTMPSTDPVNIPAASPNSGSGYSSDGGGGGNVPIGGGGRSFSGLPGSRYASRGDSGVTANAQVGRTSGGAGPSWASGAGGYSTMQPNDPLGIGRTSNSNGGFYGNVNSFGGFSGTQGGRFNTSNPTGMINTAARLATAGVSGNTNSMIGAGLQAAQGFGIIPPGAMQMANTGMQAVRAIQSGNPSAMVGMASRFLPQGVGQAAQAGMGLARSISGGSPTGMINSAAGMANMLVRGGGFGGTGQGAGGFGNGGPGFGSVGGAISGVGTAIGNGVSNIANGIGNLFGGNQTAAMPGADQSIPSASGQAVASASDRSSGQRIPYTPPNTSGSPDDRSSGSTPGPSVSGQSDKPSDGPGVAAMESIGFTVDDQSLMVLNFGDFT